MTFYTWSSSQFSQYGTKVTVSTARDALSVLDGILDNETELPIMEHTTDTAGYTYIIFALFDLLGLKFSPRLKDMADRALYKTDKNKKYPRLNRRIAGTINEALILSHWDDFLRVAGSLKLGWVSASLFVSKLQANPRQNSLGKALQEYGKLLHSIHILRSLKDKKFRHKIQKQLNKGEALHKLRLFLFFANQGKITRKYEEAQNNQALCLNLLTNIVVAWNTVYMEEVIKQLRSEGMKIKKSTISQVSPARYDNINPYGKYTLDVEQEYTPGHLRPLREVQND